MENYRIESDCIGELKIPSNVYYGVNTYRAIENFNISNQKVHSEMIKAIVQIKKACALTNFEANLLTQTQKDAIVYACDEIEKGNFHDQFVVDSIQGGAGTSFNMNANEVIANVALEYLKCDKGDYKIISPLDHVNMGQSTNDVYPTSGKIATIALIFKAIKSMEYLAEAFNKKSIEFNNVIKMGRTQLQDAIPIRLGQEFRAYESMTRRNIKLFKQAIENLETVSMGATAIGTGLNADTIYLSKIVENLSKVTSLDLKQSEDLIDGTQNVDGLVYVSGIIKNFAVGISKVANDLRLMSSGPVCGLAEINLPPRQAGSSIMPGKVNPVIPEVVSQVAFHCIGNDTTITMAAESGQLELNAFEPIIFYSLFSSLDCLRNVLYTFVDNCILGITANIEKTNEMVNNSFGIITAFTPHIGYKKSLEIIQKSIDKKISLKQAIIEENILTKEEIDSILDVFSMTSPGIAGKSFLKTGRK